MFVVASSWGFGLRPVEAQLVSYATGSSDLQGVSEADAQSALGPPDGIWIEEGFEDNASAVFRFAAPLDDVPGDDLILSIFVTIDESDASEVLVEGRAAPSDPFVEIATLNTGDGQTPGRLNPFAGYDHVHHFGLDFGGKVRKVTEVRLTNNAGSPLKLDALEGVHPALASPIHAVELRIFRLRDDFSKRFAVRWKNIAPLETGVELAGFSIEHASADWIDQTDLAVFAPDGSFTATPETTAGPDNGPRTQRTDYVWSGEGVGLAPGDIASHQRTNTIDTDVTGEEFLEYFTFTATFADGVALSANWDEILKSGAVGELFSIYQYPPGPVSISEGRPAYWYEFASSAIAPEPECTDCGPDSGDGNGNDNDPGMDNDDPEGPVRCTLGMYGVLPLTLLGLCLMRRRRP
jgi:hypothetical protein